MSDQQVSMFAMFPTETNIRTKTDEKPAGFTIQHYPRKTVTIHLYSHTDNRPPADAGITLVLRTKVHFTFGDRDRGRYNNQLMK